MGIFSSLGKLFKGKTPNTNTPESEAKREEALKAVRAALNKIEKENKETEAKIEELERKRDEAQTKAEECGRKAKEAGKEIQQWEKVTEQIKRVEKERAKNKKKAIKTISKSKGEMATLIHEMESKKTRDLRLMLNDEGQVPAKGTRREAIELVLMSRGEPPLPVNGEIERLEKMLCPANDFERLIGKLVEEEKLTREESEELNNLEVLVPETETENNGKRIIFSLKDGAGRKSLNLFSSKERLFQSSLWRNYYTEDTNVAVMPFRNVAVLLEEGVCLNINPETLFHREL